MRLRRRYVEKKLGSDLILWVDPSKIEYGVDTQFPNIKELKERMVKLCDPIPFGRGLASLANKMICRCDSFLIKPENYRSALLIEDLIHYQKVKDIIANRHQFERSLWYRMLTDELAAKGYAHHKKLKFFNKQDIACFFKEYVLGLIESMELEGFNYQKGPEYGVALIAGDGSLHKSGSGNHRFYIAKIVGVKSYPLKIGGVHQEWFNRYVHDNKNILMKLRESLKTVEERYRPTY
jgi:hypothetical protein